MLLYNKIVANATLVFLKEMLYYYIRLESEKMLELEENLKTIKSVKSKIKELGESL